MRRSKSTARAGRRRPMSKENDGRQTSNVAHMPVYQGVLNLNDPTSVRMQTSFLIKNQQAANFEQYIQMMKKRKATLMAQT